MATNIAIFPLGLQFLQRRQFNRTNWFHFYWSVATIWWCGQGQLSGLQTPPIYCMHFNFIVTSEENLLRRSTFKLFFHQIHQQNYLSLFIGIQMALLFPFLRAAVFSDKEAAIFEYGVQEVDWILGFILSNQLTPVLEHR
jgi:hypothetical protein